jgi:HSP20 family protein
VFSRRLFLGDNLDADQIQASYDGVLRPAIPMAEEANPRRIKSPAARTRRPP